MKRINYLLMSFENYHNFSKFFSTGVIILSIAAIFTFGCNSSSSSPNCMAAGTIVTIQSNHGHAFSVSVADITAASNKTYDINLLGTADHTHSVTITTADFVLLMGNTGIQETSTTSSGVLFPTPHSHVIDVGCAESSSGGGGY